MLCCVNAPFVFARLNCIKQPENDGRGGICMTEMSLSGMVRRIAVHSAWGVGFSAG